MSIRSLSVSAVLLTLLSGCSHGGRTQHAETQITSQDFAQASSVKDAGPAASDPGHVVYEEAPSRYGSQALPADIVEEFKREFHSQPTAGSMVDDGSVRGAIKRISAHRRNLPEVVDAHETYMGDAPYALDTGDRLRVTVYEQEALSRIYLVNGSGAITVPLIGRVQVRGRTTRTVSRSIRQKLSREYVKDPKVTVEVQEYRPFFIMGEVRTGGKFAYVHGMTAHTAIALAGGFSERASKSSVLVTRKLRGQTVTAKIGAQSPIMPGDVIRVEERWF